MSEKAFPHVAMAVVLPGSWAAAMLALCPSYQVWIFGRALCGCCRWLLAIGAVAWIPVGMVLAGGLCLAFEFAAGLWRNRRVA